MLFLLSFQGEVLRSEVTVVVFEVGHGRVLVGRVALGKLVEVPVLGEQFSSAKKLRGLLAINAVCPTPPPLSEILTENCLLTGRTAGSPLCEVTAPSQAPEKLSIVGAVESLKRIRRFSAAAHCPAPVVQLVVEQRSLSRSWVVPEEARLVRETP